MEGVQDFFNSPTLEKFKNIPSSQRKSLLTEYLKDDLYETSKVAKYFVSISVALKDDKDALMEWAETVLKPALESADCKEEWLISSLLIHMGLLKGEEKMEYPKDISGPLKALEYTVKQPYFPRHLKSFFVAFISKPNKLLESCSETRHQFLQTLYQI